MAAYYNEIDLYAAEWLRNLIKAGHIADGEVDTRSIVDVQSDELREFTQCHFFAGIAGWSHALRLAGWEDERQIWTGSCPCQPFSVAGQGKGTDDPRHLWPHFFRLIRGCRPPVVMGEQVAGAAGYGWLDGVRSDLESESYTIEGVDIPACSVNAPHIRSRLYWVAMDNTQSKRLERWRDSPPITATEPDGGNAGATGRNSYDMAISNIDGYDGARGHAAVQGSDGKNDGISVGSGSDVCPDLANANSGGCVEAGERGSLDTIHPRELHDRMSIAERDPCGIDMADSASEGLEGATRESLQRDLNGSASDGVADNMADTQSEQLRGGHAREPISPSSSNEGETQQREWIWSDVGSNGVNFWNDAIWLNGADGKTRRAQPDICLLAHGVPARVGKLRAYGNAIVPPLAAEVIKAFMDQESQRFITPAL